MNKSELIHEMAEDLGSEKEAVAALESLLQALSGALAEGQGIILPGFGTFKAVQRPARSGRNPKTGEAIAIAESTRCRFVPAKKLKEALN